MEKIRSPERRLKLVLQGTKSKKTSLIEEWRLLGCYAVWLLEKTDGSEELNASFIRAAKVG
jgi:hypothetical protein